MFLCLTHLLRLGHVASAPLTFLPSWRVACPQANGNFCFKGSASSQVTNSLGSSDLRISTWDTWELPLGTILEPSTCRGMQNCNNLEGSWPFVVPLNPTASFSWEMCTTGWIVALSESFRRYATTPTRSRIWNALKYLKLNFWLALETIED
jgi:hypothetical protein